MKIQWPWTKRIKRAEAEAEKARCDYEETLNQRHDVIRLAEDLTNHSVRNGWSRTLGEIFGG